MERLELGEGVGIPLGELEFAFSRSSGPGGQHVNRAETKVELRWDIAGSTHLTEAQRDLLQARLASYINEQGVLRLSSDESRSQHRNREAVIARLQALTRAALQPRRARRATRPSAGARAKRLRRKKEHAEKKARRARIDPRKL